MITTIRSTCPSLLGRWLISLAVVGFVETGKHGRTASSIIVPVAAAALAFPPGISLFSGAGDQADGFRGVGDSRSRPALSSVPAVDRNPLQVCTEIYYQLTAQKRGSPPAAALSTAQRAVHAAPQLLNAVLPMPDYGPLEGWRDLFPSAEDQFAAAAVLPYCKGLLASESHLEWPLSREETDLIQHVLEFVSSLSYKPEALMSVVRRVSSFTDSCQTGIKFLEPASWLVAQDSVRYPRAVLHQQISSPSGDGDGRTQAPKYSGVGAVESNQIAELAAEGGFSQKGNPMLHRVAHRFFMGGDLFPQSYSQASSMLKQSAVETGNGDSVSMLAVAKYLGLGTEADKVIAARLLHLAAHNLGSKTALSQLGVLFFDSAREGREEALGTAMWDEARVLLSKALDKQVPEAVESLVAMDVLSGEPVRMKWLLTLSAAVAKGFPTAAHTTAKLISNNAMGLKTCPQAWSLMARSVRRDIWFGVASRALERRGSPTELTDMELMVMAAAGVEQAEFALSQRDVFKHNPVARIRLLAFSAHRGRATAQLELARTSPIKARRRKARRAESDYDDPLDFILDQWEVDPPSYRTDVYKAAELSFANAESLVSNPMRWLQTDLESPGETVVATAEAVTELAWMAFVGDGTDQSLRDAMVWVAKLGSGAPEYKRMEWLYYAVLQAVFSINYVLLSVSRKEFVAIGVVAVALVALRKKQVP